MTPVPNAARTLAWPRNERCATPRAPEVRRPTPTPPPIALPVKGDGEPLPAIPTESARAVVLLAVAAALVVTLGAVRALAGDPLLAAAGWRGLLPLSGMVAVPLDLPVATHGHGVGSAPPPGGGSGADASVKRRGHGSIRGGVLFVPDSFASPDGAYDVLLHFHGNTAVVRESAEAANLNAIVAVVNLGVGSAPYQDAYGAPGTYEALLDEIQRVVHDRGLRRPRLRRVALSSWSAGYGALSTILEVRRGRESLDAVLVLDGIHCGWTDESRSALNPLQLAPFVAAARAAAGREMLFSITHAEIDPPTYAGSAQTAAFLLDAVRQRGASVTQAATLVPPAHLRLRAAEGAVSRRLEKKMEPVVETHAGSLHVRGYRGNTAEHHMAHLLQMGATVLPELAARWR